MEKIVMTKEGKIKFVDMEHVKTMLEELGWKVKEKKSSDKKKKEKDK